jgi:protein tyrosine phosphatase (PTP) superfamily phosphohydrolase (DUF442 family)
MDFSRITDSLYVGTTPTQEDFRRLHELGVRLVINMRLLFGQAPSRALSSIRYVRLRTFDNPLLPIPSAALVHGTRTALEVVAQGGVVYTHCSRGRHRSVAMAAAILIAQGYTPEGAMQRIREQRAVADPGASHIQPRILEFARVWHAQNKLI